MFTLYLFDHGRLHPRVHFISNKILGENGQLQIIFLFEFISYIGYGDYNIYKIQQIKELPNIIKYLNWGSFINDSYISS